MSHSLSSVLPSCLSAPYTLEVTGESASELEKAGTAILAGTPINIAFLGNETHAQRIDAALRIRACGAEPVPVISSRRLRSQQDCDALIGAFIEQAAPKRFMLVGGDPREPAGPYPDSLALLQSGVVQRHGIREVVIAGYPEGHPKIGNDALWRALEWKLKFLHDAGCTVEFTTQFGFDAQAVVEWIAQLRERGFEMPVRIGVAGPTSAHKLLQFAYQFGVTTSASMLRRYGLALTELVQPIVADRYWEQLHEGLEREQLEHVSWHIYPFGGVEHGVRWINAQLGLQQG